MRVLPPMSALPAPTENLRLSDHVADTPYAERISANLLWSSLGAVQSVRAITGNACSADGLCARCGVRPNDENMSGERVPLMMKQTFRVVTRGANGELRIRDYPSKESLLRLHSQIGVDDCSTDLSLRGLPIFRGLVGPMPDGKGVIRYESPEVFETLTKEWSSTKPARRTRRRAAAATTSEAAGESTARPSTGS